MPLRGPSAPFQLLRAGFTFFARLLSTSGTYPRRMSATYAKPMRVNAGIAQSKASSFLPIYLLPRKPDVVRELLQAAQIALLGNPNLDGLADETRLSSNQMAVGQAGFCAVGCRLVFTVRYRVKL
ncbi:MAG: hypothetical protein DMF63_08370 [Acidobacteria bacterium]|nr:MAG: hypothetical protein DMF63_08370 [Acidobacteriota bacterium]